MKLNPISVTELNKYVKDKVAEDEYLNSVLVKGEISNFKHHYTGHMYFTLKDENSLIKCVMFKTSTATLNFAPKDGMKVIVLGSVGVYERDGVYQIYCKAMQEDGMGNLYTAFEELKKKLALEGLFDEAHKKPIPFMPKIIGVLTSNTGAVIRDIINVSTRRNPNVYIRLLPVPVQGEGAGIKIANAIRLMNEEKLADVIIVARGGGSLEDLWPFNEEVVEPSCTKEGYVKITCECGYCSEEVIEKLSHHFVEGKCTCGEVEIIKVTVVNGDITNTIDIAYGSKINPQNYAFLQIDDEFFETWCSDDEVFNFETPNECGNNYILEVYNWSTYGSYVKYGMDNIKLYSINKETLEKIEINPSSMSIKLLICDVMSMISKFLFVSI